MKNVKQKSQSINILKTKHFKEKLLKLMNPGIKKEYELYIQDLIKDLNDQKNIKSLEKNIVEKEEQEKPLIHIDINLIQYIINKSRRTDDDLFILKCFLKNMDFLSFLNIKGRNDKLLLSLSKYLKMESKPKNTILFRYGNKGTKFYIVFSGQLSVLILKEMKVNISYTRYFIHLLILKILKEDGLLYKIISSNFGANRVDKNEFDFYYESINKFVNKYFGKFKNKNRFFFPQENEDENLKALLSNFNQRNHYKELLEDLDLVLDSELSSSEEEEEREEKPKLLGRKKIEINKIKNPIKKGKDTRKIKRKEILKKNPSLLKIYKINKNLNYSELPIFQIEQKKVKLIVVFFIFCKELISNKKQFLSVDDYINFTFLNSPMHKSIKCENDISENEEFYLFQYFEIAKKKKGDTFGELALQHSDNQRTGTIITLSDTVLGYLTKNDYDLSLSNIELKKRKKDVDFIMSFSLFSQMNWFVFENKYFNYFKKEKFIQGDKIIIQGQKNQKLFFIMDGQYEISTVITLNKIYAILKSKLGKNIDIKRRNFNNKTYNVRLYISSHQDLLGLNDCCFNEEISFVDATCISLESTVLTLEASILKEIRKKSPEIEIDIKQFIDKKQSIMIDRLKSFYNKIINTLDYLKKERNLSSSLSKNVKLKLNNKINKNNNEEENKNYNKKRSSNEKKTKYLSSPIKTKASINIDNVNNYSNKNGNNFGKIYINTEVKNLKMQNSKNNSMIINNKFDSFIKNINKSGFNTDRWKNKENEDYMKDKINQIMKFKSFRTNQKKRFILNSAKLNRISNNHSEKKLIELYSPINKIINKEYSKLFNWIESNNNIKKSLKDKLRYNTENKSIEIDKSNSNNMTNLLAQTISFKKKSNINIRKLSQLNTSRIKEKSKKSIIEESYDYLLNDSFNGYKNNNNIKLLNKRKQDKKINIKKNFKFKNNLEHREKRLKRLFTQFLNNASPLGNKNRKKINLKKEQRKSNIISNYEENNNLSEYTNKKLNFFLCSEMTKKEYEQKNNYYNNKALSFLEPKAINKKDCFK